MYDLNNFTTPEMMRLRAALRKLREEPSTSMESAAQKVVDCFFDDLRDGTTGERACVLARIFKTHVYSELDSTLRAAADAVMPAYKVPETTRCLTLLATRGIEPEWNSRHLSRGHRSIPLTSEQVVLQAPMIARLINDLGIPIGVVVKPEQTFSREAQEKTFNVFHIMTAAGSRYLPAQKDFILRYGVRSVLGFGGVLPTGDLFATILFTRVTIPNQVAELFAPLALNVKISLLPFSGRQTFEPSTEERQQS